MDLLRFLLPSFAGLVFFLSLIYFTSMFMIKSLRKQGIDAPMVKSARNVILLILSITYLIFVINILITNEIPRKDIDRTTQQEGINNFEQHVRELSDTTKNK